MNYYSSIRKRVLATIIDYLLYSIMWLLLMVVTVMFEKDNMTDSSLFSSWLFLGLWFLYFPLTEGITGQTIGKKIIGIRVLKPSGQEITIWDSFVRRLFDSIDFLFFGFVGIYMIQNSNKNQRIGDKVANTIVVTNNRILCNHCKVQLTLSYNEILTGVFICPSCKFENAIKPLNK